MPYLEYKCPNDHVTEKFFTTVSAGAEVDTIPCPECGGDADKIFSVPMPAHLYGQGWHKPSPTKRHSYKLCKKHGNSTSVG